MSTRLVVIVALIAVAYGACMYDENDIAMRLAVICTGIDYTSLSVRMWMYPNDVFLFSYCRGDAYWNAKRLVLQRVGMDRCQAICEIMQTLRHPYYGWYSFFLRAACGGWDGEAG
jgi:hypothetical protein